MKTSERSESVWKSSAGPLVGEELREDVDVDVVIVGAGISGMTTAYLLGRDRLRVAVVESTTIGGGETGQTTAHLASALDDRFCELERLFGPEGARLAYESHAAAIDRIEAIVEAEAIDCDFERLDGYLFLGEGQTAELLGREVHAALQAGFFGVERLPRAPGAPFDTGPCLRFPRQGQFHPLRYLAGLHRAICRDGGRVFTGAHARDIQGGDQARVVTDAGVTIRGRAVVVATNSPVNDVFAIHAKQAPYRTYAVGLRAPAGSVAAALYWDTEDPYHYVRIQRLEGGEDLLITGGEDHRTGEGGSDAAARHGRLEAWTRARFPSAGDVAFRWSGQVLEPFDGLAFIGENPLDYPNVYIATGDSGHGMTHGTIAGILLTDLVMGRENPWVALYDPKRKTVGAALEYAKGNLDVAKHYAERLRRGEVASADDIPRGEGAIVLRGRERLAVYRDDAGALHERSAICRHLGCVVHWNGAEKSWDCPCHGSRYAATGEVLTGPAVEPLDSPRAADDAEPPTTWERPAPWRKSA